MSLLFERFTDQGPARTGPGSGGSRPPESWLHRDRAHPSRPRRRRRRVVAAKALESLDISLDAVRERVREIIGAVPERALRTHDPSRAGEEGPRALASRSAATRPQLHRDRAPLARRRARGRRGRGAGSRQPWGRSQPSAGSSLGLAQRLRKQVGSRPVPVSPCPAPAPTSPGRPPGLPRGPDPSARSGWLRSYAQEDGRLSYAMLIESLPSSSRHKDKCSTIWTLARSSSCQWRPTMVQV